MNGMNTVGNPANDTSDNRYASHIVSYDDHVDQTIESGETLSDTFSKLVQDKTEEFFLKLKNGNLEPSYPIGAGSYTEKEWEKFLKCFDIMEDALREAAGLEEKRKDKTADGRKKDDISEELDIRLLFAEAVSCTYPVPGTKEEDVRYIIFYTKDGMYCKKEGEPGYEWKIEFKEDSQYVKVMNLLNSMDSRENLHFARYEYLWRDFLDDKITLDDLIGNICI